MGLLDRARTLDNETDATESGSPVRQADELIAAFRHTPEHIDYPGEFFESLRSLLEFSKGSLLFPNSEAEEFYPWINRGLDRTTSRRLRIPFDFPGLDGDDGTVFSPIDPSDLAPMLSNREFGLLGDVSLIRIGSGQPPTALILSLDGKGAVGDKDLAVAVEKLAAELGGGIAGSRNLLLEEGSGEPPSPEEWLALWEDRDTVLVILDTSPAIEALMDTVSGLELYRARRDVIALIRHITGRMGRLCDLKDGRVLIHFPADRLPDHDLYLHQLSHSFAAAIFDLEEPPVFPAEFHHLPEDRDAVRDALSGYFSG